MEAAGREASLVTVENAWLLHLVLGVPLGEKFLPKSILKRHAVAKNAPDTVLLRADELVALRAAILEATPDIQPFVTALTHLAAQLALKPPLSVVDKGHAAFGASLHDYLSIGRYHWPNPDALDGLPYIRRDGEVNPEARSDRFDAERLRILAERLTLLALAAYLLDDRASAVAANRLLECWFVNPASRQTPHLRFAQVLPGRVRDRGTGIVDGRRYLQVNDAVRLLEAAEQLEPRVGAGYHAWAEAFGDWLETSEQVQKATLAENNIGFWSDLLRMGMLRFLRREEALERLWNETVLPRFRTQVAADGSLPAEMKRAAPGDYVVFTLLALAQMEQLAAQGLLEVAPFGDQPGRNFENAYRWFRDTLLQNDLGNHVAVLQRFVAQQLVIDQWRRATPSEPTDLAAIADWDAVQGMAMMLSLVTALVARQEAQLLASTRTNADQAARLAEQQRQLEQVLERFRRSEETLARAQARVATLEGEQQRWQVRADEAQKRVLAVTRTLNDLRNSESWRYTAPLRRLGAWARDVRGRWRRSARTIAAPERTLTGSAMAPGKHNRQGARDPLEQLLAHQPRHLEALQRAYAASPLRGVPDTFALVRVIGNDLYPRHKLGQSRENLTFILEHEGALPDCTRAWVVNRIVNEAEEAAIIALLEARGEPYLRLPFEPEVYARIGFDYGALPSADFLHGDGLASLEELSQKRLLAALYRHKNNYVMHNNGARNAALAFGATLAKWVLPFDGNTFFRQEAWDALRQGVLAQPQVPMFVVPMERTLDNATLLAPSFTVQPVEEPQLLFRRDAGHQFGERFPYGRRPKVSLFWQMGVPGPWESWNDDAWDQVRLEPSRAAGQFAVAGWVARLASGMATLEKPTTASFKERGRVRQDAILATIDALDAQLFAFDHPRMRALATYESPGIDALRVRLDAGPLTSVGTALLEAAAGALGRGPYSVVEKSTLPPSQDAHDYWHPAPYWWPDPSQPDGLPYSKRDGERVPGTNMDDAERDRYDRTRLQAMFDDTTMLALAGAIRGREEHHRHAVRLLQCWFLDPATRMNPHLRFAQVRMGHNRNEGYGSGIIELKDLYYFLDAVRLLEHSGALGPQATAGFQGWLRRYRDWLTDSPQGANERAAPNNHGTYYDLQQAAIASYLGEEDALRGVLLRAEARLLTQFDDVGDQPHERVRPISAHYYLFNLQGWLNLLTIAARHGFLPLSPDVPPYPQLARAVQRLFNLAGPGWPYPQAGGVDWQRLQPLASSALRLGFGAVLPAAEQHRSAAEWLDQKARFDPHDGVAPWWNLAWSLPPAPRGSRASREGEGESS